MIDQEPFGGAWHDVAGMPSGLIQRAVPDPYHATRTPGGRVISDPCEPEGGAVVWVLDAAGQTWAPCPVLVHDGTGWTPAQSVPVQT